jgi:hypothetical protein
MKYTKLTSILNNNLSPNNNNNNNNNNVNSSVNNVNANVSNSVNTEGDLIADLDSFAQSQIVNNYKFGVLYATSSQTTDEDFLNNRSMFISFLPSNTNIR